MRYASLSEDGTVTIVYGYDPRWRSEPDPCPMVANPRYPSPDADQPPMIPEPGWVPTFTTVATGIDAVEIPAHVCAGHRLVNGSWVPPDPEPDPVPGSISRRQFILSARNMGFCTQAEALAFVTTGALPGALQSVVDALPTQTARDDATITIAGATTFERDHPLTLAIGGAFRGEAPLADFLDDFFRSAAAL
mgnify:CR=1 FL=1